MTELEAIDSRVKTYLIDIGYDKWSREHSKANRTMIMTSNIAESVNVANKHARDLPVVNLLDFMTTLIQNVIQKFHMDSYKYCSDYYSIDYLLKTYEIPVNLLPDETTWQIPEHVSSQVVLPPKGKIKPGRPKKKRGIGGWEGNTVTCALCRRKGHNRRTCQNIPKRD
uniref:Uncharacterized protein LOC104215825 n=1 Tax=Nicotiana sylvestris TaxID=4096 RepID=A0A1U7VGL5_NICSY|nr:PREDICTED: uncharacterized protein LOC104215825 [Nicotiana sylvestris]